jgi:RNA polymerase sigma-70 factor, ECF subfamily
VNPRGVFHQPDAPWSDLVRRVRIGDAEAVEDLYEVFSTGIRLRVARQLAAMDVNDKVHDLFVAVMESIRQGKVRQPERLMGYVQTMVSRQVASHIDRISKERRNSPVLELRAPLPDRAPDPEHSAIDRQIGEVMRRVLGGMRERDRQIIVRFYLKEETPQEICHAMHLTEAQYRVLKSRAKARLGDLCRRRLARRGGKGKADPGSAIN